MVEEGKRQREAPQSALQEISSAKIYRIWLVLCVMILSAAVLLPAKPDILTNFFASERAGRHVHCEDYEVMQEPEFCRDAHSDAVWWGSFSDFFSNSVVAFVLAPLAGRWSDQYGRKTFITFFIGLGAMAPLVMALHISFNLSLYYYFPAQAFAGHGGLASLCSAYITDKISPQNRAITMGLNLAGFMAAFIIGPIIGGIVAQEIAAWIGVGGVVIAGIGICLFVPESLSQAAKEKAAEKQKAESKWEQAPWNNIKILLRTQLSFRLAIVVCLAGFVAQGFMELLAQYLQMKLKYTKLDLAIVMVLAGTTGLLCQTLVLRAFLFCLGECTILLISILARIIEQLVLCAAWSRPIVIFAICFGSLAALMMPVSLTLLSKNVAAYEQGTAQGALYGLLALSQGLGPLVFAFLFSGFTRSDSTWPYMPGAPYIFGAGLMVPCFFIALTLDRRAEAGIQEDADYQEMSNMTDPKPSEMPAAPSGLLTASSMLQRGLSTRLHSHRSTSLEMANSVQLSQDSGDSNTNLNPQRSHSR